MKGAEQKASNSTKVEVVPLKLVEVLACGACGAPISDVGVGKCIYCEAGFKTEKDESPDQAVVADSKARQELIKDHVKNGVLGLQILDESDRAGNFTHVPFLRAKSVIIGYHANVDRIVAQNYFGGEGSKVGSVVTDELQCGLGAKIDAAYTHHCATQSFLTAGLVVVHHQGTLKIGYESKIRCLVVGDDVKLKIGEQSRIDLLVETDHDPSIYAELGTNIKSRFQIESDDVPILMDSILNLSENENTRIQEVDRIIRQFA